MYRKRIKVQNQFVGVIVGVNSHIPGSPCVSHVAHPYCESMDRCPHTSYQ